MPARNVVKTYFENGFYHVYNRGVEKREIFIDKQDYVVFLGVLTKYLTPTPPMNNPTQIKPLVPNTLHDEIDLLAYCLMPNHFHMIVQQKKIDSMMKLIQRVSTSYSIYFNKKYQRVGSLFQGVYKAVTIDNENYLLHLSRYIHLNPLELLKVSPSEGETLESYRWSSYPEYIGKRKTEWIKTDLISSYFSSAKSSNLSLKNLNAYQNFVEEYPTDAVEILGNLALDQVHISKGLTF